MCEAIERYFSLTRLGTKLSHPSVQYGISNEPSLGGRNRVPLLLYMQLLMQYLFFYSEFELHLQIVHKDTLSKIEAKPKKHGPPRVLFNLPLFKFGK